MTDQIPADEVRKIIAFYRDGASDRGGMILDALRDLLPPPPLPTLADMTDEERAACQWMQADVGVERRIIVRVMDVEEGAVTLVESGDTVVCPHSSVTPRPDLPRFTWPGEQQTAPAPALPEGWRFADHKDHGRVIVTNTTPDEDGHVYFVAPAPDPLGNDWHPCDPAELTYLDTGQEVADAVD